MGTNVFLQAMTKNVIYVTKSASRVEQAAEFQIEKSENSKGNLPMFQYFVGSWYEG